MIRLYFWIYNKGDNNPSIALAWTGDDGDTLLAITTYESYVSHPSKIYRSIDAGRNWEEITDKIDNELIRRKSGVLTSPADSKRVILVVNNHPMGYATTSEIYVTLDKGTCTIEHALVNKTLCHKTEYNRIYYALMIR